MTCVHFSVNIFITTLLHGICVQFNVNTFITMLMILKYIMNVLLFSFLVTYTDMGYSGPFEYPGEGLSVGCTSHPGVRSVSLIDPGLTLLSYKKKVNS